jgi:hypothetical protein
MAKRKTLYELAQTVAGHREYLKSLGNSKSTHMRKLRCDVDARLQRSQLKLYATSGSDLATAIFTATQDARLATLNDFEKRLRACGGGHIEALEILATMKGEVQ